MSELTEARLAEIAARCEAATPGPWRADEACEGDDDTPPGWGIDGPKWIDDGEYLHFNEADAEFIAHARTDLPLLHDAYRSLQERERVLVAMLRRLGIRRSERVDGYGQRYARYQCLDCCVFVDVDAAFEDEHAFDYWRSRLRHFEGCELAALLTREVQA